MSVSEAQIQGELYRHLKNHVETGKAVYDGIEFKEVEQQKSIKVDGRTIYADLVVSDTLKRYWVVIENKRLTKYGQERIFDPYSQDVISQAQRYASELGAPYFGTCNGRVLVLFQTFEQFVPMSQRRRVHYELSRMSLQQFADRLLNDIVGLQKGTVKWLPVDEAFIARMRTLHSAIAPLVYQSLLKRLSSDEMFAKEYRPWIESQGWKFTHETNEHVASMAAHLLINKLLFYKILETYNTNVMRLRRIDLSTTDLTTELKRYFRAVLEIDYEPVYEETLYDKISIPSNLLELLSNYVEELSLTDLREIKSDVIGTMYERLIPKDERKTLGQYYTPPQIVEFITRICIFKPEDTVLDPCCGSGGFLVKAYHHLLSLKRLENPLLNDEVTHKELLRQIHGVEINQFPAHLSTINLAIQNVRSLTNQVLIKRKDFFRVKPEYHFDCVMANPPYVRQEDIVEKDAILASTLEGWEDANIDGQSDIYVYFFLHSAKFLKDGGRIGYITSDKWLEVGYGEQLQKFFLNNFKIKVIMSFDTGVFEDADVNTCVTILEKESDARNRASNEVKFVRLKQPIAIGSLIDAIQRNLPQDDETLRLITVRQDKLSSQNKWSIYHKAPNLYWRIAENDKIVPLSELADIRFAVKTGNNRFFVMTMKEAKRWGISGKHLRPAITNPEKHPKIVIEKQDLKEFFFTCHQDKNLIDDRGALAYIEWGENAEYVPKQGKNKGKTMKGFHTIKSVQGRKLWYDLGERRIAPLVIPRRCDINFRCFWNKAGVLALDVFYHIYPKDRKTIEYLLAVLNSTVTPFLVESRGRAYALGVLEVEVYELERLPVPDLAQVSSRSMTKIQRAFRDLIQAQQSSAKEHELRARRKLDEAILETLGLGEKELDELYTQLVDLRRMRREREKKILVETEEKPRFRKTKRTRRDDLSSSPTAVLPKWFPERKVSSDTG